MKKLTGDQFMTALLKDIKAATKPLAWEWKGWKAKKRKRISKCLKH